MFANIIISVLALGMLITIHELGHFLMALMMGVKVEIFSIGFGRTLWKKEYRGTEYRISMIPLGGYVGILNDGSEPALNNKPAWRKALIAFAGPMANLLMAFVIFSSVNFIGTQTPSKFIQAVNPGTPAEKAGIASGDEILGAPGIEFQSWNDVVTFIGASPSTPITLNIRKSNGDIVHTTITPQPYTVRNADGENVIFGKIGITPQYTSTRHGFIDANYLAAKQLVNNSYLIVEMLGKMLSNQISSDAIAGPLMIVKIAGEQADAGLIPLLMFVAMLSLNLAIFNLLPIPILDGGQLVLLLIESVKGSPIGERTVDLFHRTGFALMASLFVYAFYNDIMKLLI